MKKCLILLVIVLSCLTGQAWSEDPDGKEIINIHNERHSVNSAKDTIIMLLIDKKGNQKKRIMKRYGKKSENGLSRSLIAFIEPADIKGVALLTWELSRGQNKQWLYLPDQKAMQRISSRARKSPFMGSDFTYEDLQPDLIDNYIYSDPGTEIVDGKECYVIEITPATREKAKLSSYGKRIVWIRKDILFTIKIEFYGHRKKLVKTQTNHSLTNIEGDAWFAKKIIMEDHRKKHQTLMGVQSKDINIDLDDNIFSEKFILSGKHIY